jgi:phage anti-repressor protein
MSKWYKESKMSFNKAMDFLMENDAYQQWVAKGDYVAVIDMDGDVGIMTKNDVIAEAEDLKEMFDEGKKD